MSMIRTRWAAVGAALAVSLGAGGVSLVGAAEESSPKPVYTAITTCRIADTRADYQIGDKTTPFGPEETHTVMVWGDNGECTGIPDDVTAVQLNVTAVGATQQTHLTIWPDGDVPNGSSLNPPPGGPPTPNAVTVDLADDGSFQIYNFQGEVDLIVDVVGIYRDHHHDDRYYTESEIDARIGNPDEIMVAASSFLNTAADWTGADTFTQKASTGSPVCTSAPITIPVGRTVNSFDVMYEADATTVSVSVSGFPFAAGAYSSTTIATTGDADVPGVGAAEFTADLVNLPATGTPEASAADTTYQVNVCTSASFTLFGVNIHLAPA